MRPLPWKNGLPVRAAPPPIPADPADAPPEPGPVVPAIPPVASPVPPAPGVLVAPLAPDEPALPVVVFEPASSLGRVSSMAQPRERAVKARKVVFFMRWDPE